MEYLISVTAPDNTLHHLNHGGRIITEAEARKASFTGNEASAGDEAHRRRTLYMHLYDVHVHVHNLKITPLVP